MYMVWFNLPHHSKEMNIDISLETVQDDRQCWKNYKKRIYTNKV